MSVPVKDFLKNRRDRAVGTVLGYCERQTWWERLPRAEKEALRQKVIDAANSYHDTVLDLVKAEDLNGGVLNEAALELLRQIDRNTKP